MLEINTHIRNQRVECGPKVNLRAPTTLFQHFLFTPRFIFLVLIHILERLIPICLEIFFFSVASDRQILDKST
jgi:hypothetical protein